MPQFTDSTGRAWPIALTIGDARRIKRAGVLDLLNPDRNDPTLVHRLHDTETVIDLVWLLVEPAATAAGVSEDDFLRALDGPAALRAEKALRETVSDFFRDRRDDQVKALETLGRLIEAEVAVNLAVLDDPQTESQAQTYLREKRDTLLSAAQILPPQPATQPTAGT